MLNNDIVTIGGTTYYPVAIDLGNSRVKTIIGNKFIVSEYSAGWETKIMNYLKSINHPNVLISFCSVNPLRQYELEEAVASVSNYAVKNIEEVLFKHYRSKYSHIKGIGIDRVMGIMGALQYYEPPFITVDSGTALTINAVDKDGFIIGGAIAAGIKTQMDGLSRKTSGLKKTELRLPERAAGRDSIEALCSGIICGTVGVVKEIVGRITAEEFEGRKASVIITGGDSDLLVQALRGWNHPFFVKKHLILKGIFTLINDIRVI